MDEAAANTPFLTRRKREGVVYTPAPIARFLVERTIALSLDQVRASLAEAHRGRETIAFWRAWLAALRSFAIVDPGCGEGALLIAAADEMARRYREAAERLRALAAADTLDPAREAILHNLFGVDIDPHATARTRRALMRLAPCDDVARRLEETIRTGDSLVDDAAVSEHGLDWGAAFPHAAARGFDVVIANPPYVRMEHLKPLKPWLAQRYEVAAERADLYAYFFEKGLALLKRGGRLGFVCSATFFRTGSGESLRALLARSGAIECVVDFGDVAVFDGVVAYPAILTLRKGAASHGDLTFLNLREAAPDDLGAAFREKARPMPRTRLGAGFWRFEDESLARLRDKIARGRSTLAEVHGSPLWGVKTGLNDAFLIDAATRERIIAEDARSAAIVKPYARGAHIGRWRVDATRLWLIDLPKGGGVDIAGIPAVAAHLSPFRPRLEARATRQKWFELQQPQLAYRAAFARPKIVFPDIAQGPKFALDDRGTLIDATAFALPCADPALLALLNSRLAWFFLHSVSNPLRGGKWRLRLKAQYVGLVPIPPAPPLMRERLAAAARAIGEAARELATADPVGAARIASEIDAREREIDAIVYSLFELTADEIAAIESSLEGQY
ncbi:N-6 DNA methylase [Methylosinus sp. Sm6]|uniref:Eco57I restriction-modification methylase domain-containing protein n=1 Tax=Methylosinus sp. Sm6 TaxID=2866948 RepID=UPI001C9A1298|nr:N-6 DNA methylase [Methylosinus sp. Sm6]MBY6241376.1 N-6 DNA methylase [Methylosinus sp. Sm6]